MNYIFAIAAENDLADAIHWYQEQREGLGKEFVDEVDITLQRICEHPFLYCRLNGEFRKASLNRFPYSIIYRIISDTIEVAAVFHMRRNPKLWQKRLT